MHVCTDNSTLVVHVSRANLQKTDLRLFANSPCTHTNDEMSHADEATLPSEVHFMILP